MRRAPFVNIDRDEGQSDWDSARVLDPPCGEGVFLAPVARRMADSLKETIEVAIPFNRPPSALEGGQRLVTDSLQIDCR